MAWRASPPALGIAYCTRLPWAPPARWGFPPLSGTLALNLGSLPNAGLLDGRRDDEVRLDLSSRFPPESRPSGVLLILTICCPPPPPSLSGKGCALLSLEVGRVVGVAFGNGMYGHPRSMEWAEGQRLACVGARGRRPLRLNLRFLSLQTSHFTSPSVRFGVVTFISGSW